ncbi:MAG TPA: phosphatase PAP2 family protein [Parafilimonas sp.]|nr:phosphatase PAP2 family protein [Parafilimonas sp.]
MPAFATCFNDTKWVPIVAYSAAGLVGLCRIYNNTHRASDVLAGAACGFGSVKAMNGIYSLLSKRFSFIPQVYDGHYGFTVLYCLK